MRVVNKRSALGASVFSVEDGVGHLQGEGGGGGAGELRAFLGGCEFPGVLLAFVGCSVFLQKAQLYWPGIEEGGVWVPRPPAGEAGRMRGCEAPEVSDA